MLLVRLLTLLKEFDKILERDIESLRSLNAEGHLPDVVLAMNQVDIEQYELFRAEIASLSIGDLARLTELAKEYQPLYQAIAVENNRTVENAIQMGVLQGHTAQILFAPKKGQ